MPNIFNLFIFIWENGKTVEEKNKTHILLILCTLYGLIYSLNMYRHTTPDIHQNIYSLMVKKIEFSFQFRYMNRILRLAHETYVYDDVVRVLCTCGQQYSKFFLSLARGLKFIIILNSLNI